MNEEKPKEWYINETWYGYPRQGPYDPPPPHKHPYGWNFLQVAWNNISSLMKEEWTHVIAYSEYEALKIEAEKDYDDMRIFQVKFIKADHDRIAAETAAESYKTNLVKVEDVLRGIIELGKRDLSNPKYDSYFEEAPKILEEARKTLEGR